MAASEEWGLDGGFGFEATAMASHDGRAFEAIESPTGGSEHVGATEDEGVDVFEGHTGTSSSITL